ncbi:MAG: RrF2 family transcriptional regulator [Candidatus Sumerlaeaceae bacterium]
MGLDTGTEVLATVYLTLHSDYALRVLIYLSSHDGSVIRTSDISEAYNISRNHLVRVVQTLARSGFVKVTAGRSGGMRLARPASEINLGQVFRATEPCFNLVECFDMTTNTCPIAPVCRLKPMLREAAEAFLGVLDKYSLGDVARGESHSYLQYFLPARSRTEITGDTMASPLDPNRA